MVIITHSYRVYHVSIEGDLLPSTIIGFYFLNTEFFGSEIKLSYESYFYFNVYLNENDNYVLNQKIATCGLGSD